MRDAPGRSHELTEGATSVLCYPARHGDKSFGDRLKEGIRVVQPLRDGFYPFIDERLPLAELVMVEAPRDLESLFKSQSAANGIDIIRDEPVELSCSSERYPDATFLVYWPSGSERIHMLVPKKFASGLA